MFHFLEEKSSFLCVVWRTTPQIFSSAANGYAFLQTAVVGRRSQQFIFLNNKKK
jgi:hypothetical protein